LRDDIERFGQLGASVVAGSLPAGCTISTGTVTCTVPGPLASGATAAAA